jgi:methylmalonyl-CoA mutase cobalamin-binding domain/chain
VSGPGERFSGHRPRILLAKSFIDSHDRAIKTIAMTLRDAGMEVVLLDYEVPDDIVRAAHDEDVDVIGLSFMSGGQVQVTQRVVELLASGDSSPLPLVVGGTIRPFDLPEIEACGVRAVFRGGEALESIVATFGSLADERGGATR